MIDAHVHLRRMSLADLVEAKPAGNPVLDSWDLVVAAAERLGLSDTLSLFARPSVTRDNGATAGEAVWYGSSAGLISSLGELDAGKREAATAELARALDRLRPLLDDQGVGATFAAWLNLPSLDDDVLFVNDQVVITNWGLLPVASALSPAARRSHFQRGLGRLLPPGMPVPPFGADEGRIAQPESGAPIAPSQRAAIPIQPAASGQAERVDVGVGAKLGTASETRQPAAVVGSPVRPWLPVAIATGIAAIILLILMIPGVLIYPSASAVVRAPVDPDLIAQTRDTLERRVRALQAMLRQGVCVPVPASPIPLPRSDVTPGTSAPGSPPASGSSPGGLPSTQSLVPASPGSLAGPQSSGSRPSNLIAHLDRITVLIIAPQANGAGASFGTGFFVNDRHVVTNRHVVEEADPQRIYLINKLHGRAVQGRVAAASRSSDIGGDDFAVIEVSPEQGRPVIALTTVVARGDSVIAAGFPSFVMGSDVGYQRLLGGDLSAVPDPAVTQGWVTALQTSERGFGVLVHGATISKGNSGGPLSDLCGRSVGVNTFGRVDADNALRLNFALRTEGLRRFLSERQIAFSSDDSACQPTRAQTATGEPPRQQNPALLDGGGSAAGATAPSAPDERSSSSLPKR